MNVSSVQKQAKDRISKERRGHPPGARRPKQEDQHRRPGPRPGPLRRRARGFRVRPRGLAPEVLEALAKVLFDGNAEYDPAIDMLRPVKREEPRPLGIHPPPITETMTLPVYQAGPLPPDRVGTPPPKARRAGWVE